jgi:hypothetical protein
MRYLGLILALLAPAPAFALSCMAPSVEHSYASYAAAEETYVVIHGRLTLDMSKLPRGVVNNRMPPEQTNVKGHIGGLMLTEAGFTQPFEQDLTLEVSCLGRWCGMVQNGEDVLAFVRKDAQGYALAVNPCGRAVFSAPKRSMLKRAKQGMKRNDCTAF